MSIKTSSVINLYDGETETHHFRSKVSPDKVEIKCSTLPIILQGTTISLKNENGNTIPDVVLQITNLKKQTQDLSMALKLLTERFNLLTEVVELASTYILTGFLASPANIAMTHKDGREMSPEDRDALVGKFFTYRDLNNTAIILFTAVDELRGGMYTDTKLYPSALGEEMFIVNNSNFTGDRAASYIMIENTGEVIDIAFPDGTALSLQQKHELTGRSFTYDALSNTPKYRFASLRDNKFYFTQFMPAGSAVELFLI